MSSYFDMMGECLNNKEAFIKLILKQYLEYLYFINEKSYAKDNDKVLKFLDRFYKIESSSALPEYKLSALHDLAHDVGRSKLKLKDGTYAGDNPRSLSY